MRLRHNQRFDGLVRVSVCRVSVVVDDRECGSDRSSGGCDLIAEHDGRRKWTVGTEWSRVYTAEPEGLVELRSDERPAVRQVDRSSGLDRLGREAG